MKQSKNNIKEKIHITVRYLCIFSFLLSCDFSSRLQKEILIAQNFISDHQYNKAEKQYENILKLDPPTAVKVKIFYQLGELNSLHLGKYAAALDSYEKIIEFSNNPLWLVKAEERIANIKFNFTKDYSGAVESYGKLYNYKPTLDRQDFYYYMLGVSCQNSGRLDESIEIFEKIIEQKDHAYHLSSFYELGLSYFHKKDWANSIKFWIEYLKREQRSDYVVKTKFLLGNAYETMEDLKSAYDIYYSILGEYPNTEVIKGRLKSLYSRRIARKR